MDYLIIQGRSPGELMKELRRRSEEGWELHSWIKDSNGLYNSYEAMLIKPARAARD